MRTVDFREHNKEAKRVWESFERGCPIRMPMMLGINTRFYFFTPGISDIINPEGYTFYEYLNDPFVMMLIQCRCENYRRNYIPGDHEMGIPENGWTILIDFQNYYEAAWFGCEVNYDSTEPDSKPLLNDDNKNMLFDRGIPDPFENQMRKSRDFYEYMIEQKSTFTYKDIPVNNIAPCGLSTDGPITMACNLRGTSEFCMDIYQDPEYAKQLLSFITEATIKRIKAWRKYLNKPIKDNRFWFADDSVQLISTQMYKELVLPFHKKLVSELSVEGSPVSIHLCGDATRHFPILRDELNVTTFDTGFPVNHGELSRVLGPDIVIRGGPKVVFLMNSSPEMVKKECERIIADVIPYTRRFILREANEMPPGVPIENLWAMYDVCRTTKSLYCIRGIIPRSSAADILSFQSDTP